MRHHGAITKALRCCLVASGLGLASLATPARPAHAEDAKACAAAFDQAQVARDEGKYRQARARFAACARDACPKEIRVDCIQGLRDTDNNAPTVVIAARDAQGRDLALVRVFVDGELLLERLDGQPTTVDSGLHTFRYELSGEATREQQIVLRTGEKNRVLTVQFGTPAPAPTLTAETPSTPPRPSSPAASPPAVPTLAWVLGGVAVAAFASEAFFGFRGMSAHSACKDRLGTTGQCSASEVSAVDSKFVIADISLGVGLVSAGAAAYVFFTQRPTTEQALRPSTMPVSLDVRPTTGGGVAKLGVQF